MDAASIERAATLIRLARSSRTPLEPLPDDVRPVDEADAYAVQHALNRQLTASGAGPVTGHKIGCTTKVMQAYLGIPNPCAGEVFGPTTFRDHGRFVAADHVRVGVECELAVELAASLTTGPFSRDAVGAAIGAIAASIEVVDDRYRDYPTLGTPTLIADDFFNAGEVLGQPVREWRRFDLATLGGRMLINGEVVGEGRGADILGHPLEALAWLAGARAARGRPLLAGEFVTLGSLVATRWVAAADEVRIELDGLPPASASFV